MKGKDEIWSEAPRPEGNSDIAATLGISPLTARLIRNRAGLSLSDVRYYLDGTIEDLADAYLMKGMEEAVNLLLLRAFDGLRVRIVGDYDIDGVNSAFILQTAFGRCGITADTVIPHRIRDGYGINKSIIKAAYDDGIDTIVTCDNGIAAIEEISYAKSLGLTVIVTDHHDIPYAVSEDGSRNFMLPPADVIVNPKQPGCPYPFKRLCGAAVAWRLAECLYGRLGIPKEEYLSLAECAAVATVGDVMDLIGENRIIVKYGLERLEHTENPGYRALIRAVGLENKHLSAYHIGFVIGPCINACGRLDSADKALLLLNAQSDDEAATAAEELCGLNELRKSMTEEGVKKAVEMIENSPAGRDRVLVVYLADCHESVAGIIAGRLRERYCKPCFVLTQGEECIKGSGRSIPAFHMFDEMTKCRDLFIRYGGHPMAAGLSIEADNIELFRKTINQNCTLTDEDLRPVRDFDAILPIRHVNEGFVEELSILEPCGTANPRPLFAASGLCAVSARLIGKNGNILKACVSDGKGTRMNTVTFGASAEDLQYIEGRNDLCMLYHPEINEYAGRREIQTVVESWMRAGDGKSVSGA